MKKVIKLNENDIEKLVNKIINEGLEKGDDEYEIRLAKMRLKNSVTNLLEYGVESGEIESMVNFLIKNF